jgi:hypothetical protein
MIQNLACASVAFWQRPRRPLVPESEMPVGMCDRPGTVAGALRTEPDPKPPLDGTRRAKMIPLNRRKGALLPFAWACGIPIAGSWQDLLLDK